MSDAQTPEARAEELVAVRHDAASGLSYVELGGPPGAPVRLGPYQNPDNAKGDAARIRRWVAALIHEMTPRRGDG
jgi:hypothetical protein